MLNIPDSAAEVENRAKTDVQRELADSNPFLKNSWLGALITGYANRIFDFYLQLTEAIKQNFPDTATNSFLERWAAIWGKQRQAATSATGNAFATGVTTTNIPISTPLNVSGSGYLTTSAATITASTINADSITRSGQTATVKTVSDHGLASGVSATMALAANAEYNITAVITVTALDEFEYQIVGTPADEPATSATVSFTGVSVPIESDDFGLSQNLEAGEQLRLQSPIADVDDVFTVDFGAIGGGTDQETDTSLRARLLERIQNPVAHFNVSDITDKAKEVAGVTRVFVQEITPLVGQVTIYFMRDNDDAPIPTGSEVTTVKDKILEIKPANTSDDDVIVAAPTGITTAYSFSALSPNTSSMQAAVIANLEQFYAEGTDVGIDIPEDAYRSAIFNTVDTATGAVIESFTLSAPSGDITIASGEIGVLGNVTF